MVDNSIFFARLKWFQRAIDDLAKPRLVPVTAGEQVMGLPQRMQPGEEGFLLGRRDTSQRLTPRLPAR